MTALSAADLAAWHCTRSHDLEFQVNVRQWLTDIGVPARDTANRPVAEVRLERHGDQTTVVVTRRTPAGVPPVRERWPMSSPPPARPADAG